MPETTTKTAAEQVAETVAHIKTENEAMSKALKALNDDKDGLVTKHHDAIVQLETQQKELIEKIKTLQVQGHDGRIKATGGFASFGEFATHVKAAIAGKDMSSHERLTKASATTIATGASGSDGGYMVPEEWSSRILEHAFNEQAILPRTTNITVSGNMLGFVRDEKSPWDGTGIQAYWMDDHSTTAITQSKPAFTTEHMDLKKIAALVPVADTLLEDATGLGSYIMANAPLKIRYKVDDAIINGDGNGKPLGILSAKNGALVSVAKETSQTADTVSVANLAKMYARMPASSIGNAVWLMNQDVLPQLLQLSVGNVPVYLAGGMLTNAPMGTILGRPVIFCEQCQTLGDKGDIIFADLTAYLTSTKAGGIQTAQSIHLWFDQDLTAFRFLYRVNGQPWPKTYITPDNGSANRSYFVTLDARA